MAKLSTLASRRAALKTSTATKEPAFTVEVAGDIGTFEAGQILDNPKDIAAYYRAALNEGMSEGQETELTDDEIMVVVRSTDVTGLSVEDADVARCEALEGYDPKVLEDTRAPEVHAETDAYKIGQHFGKATVAELQVAADSDEKLKGTPLLIAHGLDQDFVKVDANGRTVDQTLGWVVPGTWHDKIPAGVTVDKAMSAETYWKKHSNSSPDHYKRVDASGNNVIGSVYGDMVDGTSFGQTVTIVRNILKKFKESAKDVTAAEKKILSDNGENPDILDDENAQKTAMSRWNRRRNTAARKLRAAVSFRIQCRAIDECKHAQWQFVDDDLVRNAKKGEPLELATKSNQALAVSGKVKIAKSRPMSISTFNSLKVAKAIAEDGGTLKSLMQTVARKKKETPAAEGDAEGLSVKVPNAKQAFSILGVFGHFFKDTKSVAELTAEYNGPDTDDEIIDLSDLVASLEDFYAPFHKRAENIRQQRHEATRAAIEAKAAADAKKMMSRKTG